MTQSDNLRLIVLVLGNGLVNDPEYAADAFELLTGKTVTSEHIAAARRFLDERRRAQRDES